MKDTNSKMGENFSHIYPLMNTQILENGTYEPSRYGDTMELMDYKTKILNPVKRCVGGQRRDINIFFLLAEAMWIWVGRKDVEFLTIFNTRMSEFSDDGKVFHAPYGFRLRNWGESSNNLTTPTKPQDQIKRAIELFNGSAETRRVVLSIWNPELDLFNEKPTKDTPCNDLLMFKVRNNCLHLTISNRSNDLHWGLPTNVFQFSFILEIMAKILGFGVGKQVHNSDSLHIYVNNENNKIHEVMTNEWNVKNQDTLYDIVEPSRMDFCDTGIATKNLEQVDDVFNRILDTLSAQSVGEEVPKLTISSKYFQLVFDILSVYVSYTKTKRNDEARLKAIFDICNIQYHNPICHDYVILALNWFYTRLKSEDAVQAAMSEIKMLSLVPELNDIDYSYVGKL